MAKIILFQTLNQESVLEQLFSFTQSASLNNVILYYKNTKTMQYYLKRGQYYNVCPYKGNISEPSQ